MNAIVTRHDDLLGDFLKNRGARLIRRPSGSARRGGGRRACCAIVSSSAWDVVAWNRAATMVLTDCSKLARPPRHPETAVPQPVNPGVHPHWESQARAVFATFRLQTARTGGGAVARALVDEMCGTSPEFAALWRANDLGSYGEGVKHIRDRTAGLLALEYSFCAVDGQPDLNLLIYTPATPEDVARVRTLLDNESRLGTGSRVETA